MDEPYGSELGRLHQAAVTGQVTLVRCLLSKGASVNTTDDSNQTALHLVSESDSKYSQRVVDVLMEYGATLDARTKWGSTPLHWACWLGNKDVAEALLRHNARTDIVDGECMTPLHALAISKIFHASLVDSLLERGASVNAKDSRRRTPLHYFSCRPGKTYAVLAILNKDGNANLQDSGGNTPLHLACQSNLREVVSLLLERGARVEARNHDGMTALHLAALRSSEDVLDVLVDNGADVNAQDSQGNTPLHHVCSVSDTLLDHINSSQRFTFVQKLLKSGVRIHLKNKLLRTACDESVTAVQRLSDCTSMFKLTARLKIADLMKQKMFKREMSKPQDEEDLTSTASCSFDVFNHPESIIDMFDPAQSKCSHKTLNYGTPSCKILALKQPDYLVWRDLLLFFSQCLHSANPSHTSSLVCSRTRTSCERSNIMISQLLQSRRRWNMMKKLPFPKTVIAMIFLYSKSHQIFNRNRSIEN